MSHVSRFIVIFLYCCLNTVNTQTGDSDPGLVPEGQLIYIGNPWNQKLNLPDIFCPFCGIWLNFTAKWQPAPEFNAEYTIKFTFKHSNLEETKTNDVMKIPYDKIKTHKDINICFSPGPIMDKNIFTLYAETDNIKMKNPVDIQVTVEMDYSGRCHTKTKCKEGIEFFPYEIWIHRIIVAAVLSSGVSFLLYRKKVSYSAITNLFKDASDEDTHQGGPSNVGTRSGDPTGLLNHGLGGDTSSSSSFLMYRKKDSYSTASQDVSEDSLQGGPSGVGSQSGDPTGLLNHGLSGDTSSSSSAAGGENPNEVVVKSLRGGPRSRPKDTKEKKEQ